MVSKSSFYGWKNAWLLFFIYMATTGMVFYAFTVIFPVMIVATGWNRGDASIASSLNMLMMGCLVPLAAVMLDRIGSRRMITIGLIILSIGLLLLGTIAERMWHWIALWGIVIPVAVALCGFYPVQITVMSWFERKRATALGFVMTGAALGGLIAQPVYTWFMQVVGSWRTGWLLSAAFAAGALVLSFWVRGKPADVGQSPDGIEPGNGPGGVGQDQGTARTYKTPASWPVRDVFRTHTIWFIVCVMMTQGMPTILLTTHGILHLTDLGYSQMESASILMLVIMGSGLARFPAGWLGDRIEPRWIISASLVLMLAAFIGIWRGTSLNSLMVFGPLFGVAYGALLVMISTMIANYFGPACFVGVSAVIAPILTIVSASIPTAAGYAADKLGSYDIVFTILTALIIAAIVSSAFLSPPERTVENLLLARPLASLGDHG